MALDFTDLWTYSLGDLRFRNWAVYRTRITVYGIKSTEVPFGHLYEADARRRGKSLPPPRQIKKCFIQKNLDNINE